MEAISFFFKQSELIEFFQNLFGNPICLDKKIIRISELKVNQQQPQPQQQHQPQQVFFLSTNKGRAGVEELDNRLSNLNVGNSLEKKKREERKEGKDGDVKRQ